MGLFTDRLLTGMIAPPPGSGVDKTLCYTKPDVLCSSLMEGHREMVATWYLPPARYAAEFFICGMLFLLTFYLTTRSTPKPRVTKAKPHPFRLPLPFGICAGFLYVAQAVFKMLGYPGKIWFLLMPCNILLLVTVLLSLPESVISGKKKRIAAELWQSWQLVVWVVFQEGDTRDLTLPFEVEFFWLYHVVLMIVPIYYVATKQVSVSLDFSFVKWTLAGIAAFGIVYFIVATPLSFLVGININYMTSPPVIPVVVGMGDNYRIATVGGLGTGFFIARFVSWIVCKAVGVLGKKKATKSKKKR